MVLALMDMMLNPDLPAVLAVEHIRQVRGPGAVKTIKVSVELLDILLLTAAKKCVKRCTTTIECHRNLWLNYYNIISALFLMFTYCIL